MKPPYIYKDSDSTTNAFYPKLARTVLITLQMVVLVFVIVFLDKCQLIMRLILLL